MNKTLKSAIIQILKAVVKLNDLASSIPFGVALKTNPYMVIAKVILGFLSVVADWLLISLVAVKETVPTLLKYDPLWIRGKLSGDEPENRQIRLRNRIKRGTADAKIAWFAKFGDPDIYIKKIRNKDTNYHGPKE